MVRAAPRSTLLPYTTLFRSRKFEKEEKKRKFHRVERGYGTFMRSFTLPDDADGKKVKAEFKNGLLTVHLTKNEHAKTRSEEHTSELQSHSDLVCRLLLEKKN